ncbi:MAG: hypothetical protein M9894_31400 [Planctomycetes bacterium]|nr:hypothetical protein [Planctomycetota bacterium]
MGGKRPVGQVAKVVALVLLLATPALCTTVLRFSLDELIERADVIVHGECVGLAGRETPDGVVTEVQLRVTEVLKGEPARTFTFTTYGGTTPKRGTFIAGSPQFEVGEELVLFLDRPNRHGYRMAIGMSQGKYTVREEGGRKVAIRNLAGLRLIDPRTGEVEEGSGDEQGLPLADLLRTVKDALAAPTTRPGEDR